MSDAVPFYDYEKRRRVEVERENVTQASWVRRDGKIRYGLQGKLPDGRTLTRYVTKAEWHTFGMVFKADHDKVKGELAAARREIEALRVVNEALLAALEPFAAMHEAMIDHTSHGDIFYSYNETVLMRDDLRLAAELVKKGKPE